MHGVSDAGRLDSETRHFAEPSCVYIAALSFEALRVPHNASLSKRPCPVRTILDGGMSKSINRSAHVQRRFVKLEVLPAIRISIFPQMVGRKLPGQRTLQDAHHQS